MRVQNISFSYKEEREKTRHFSVTEVSVDEVSVDECNVKQAV